MITETFMCGACAARARFTVHTDRPRGPLCDPAADPRITDRMRLLAASNGWVIDFARQAWCPRHRDHATPR